MGKDFLRTLILLVSLPLFFGSCVVSSADAQDWARQMFTEFEHDFGTVAKNEKAEYRFAIKNNFKEDIRIRGVSTSCACTDVSMSKNLIRSRETVYLIANFNTRNFVGQKQATVTVHFDHPFPGEVQLTVRGFIRNDVMFEPGMIDFGALNQQSLSTRSANRNIRITKYNNPNWRIVDVKSTFPHVGVALTNPTQAGAQVSYNMDVRIKDSSPAGFVQGELLIVAEEFGRRTNIPIKFSAKVASALQISPEVLTVTSIQQGESVSKKVIVKAAQPFRVSDITCSSESFSAVTNPEKSKKVHFINVDYTADQPPGRYEYELEFITDLNKRTVGKMKAVIEVTAAAAGVEE